VATKAVVDASSVKMTTDLQGKVWLIDGEGMPVNTGIDDKIFSYEKVFDRRRLIRIPGLARNARLLINLYQCGETISLEVCSPTCSACEYRNDPALLLYNARSFEHPASVGGWHRFTPKDYQHYLLADKVYRNLPFECWATCVEEVSSHPAYPAAMFVRHLDEGKLAHLLGLIIDPRWFVDIEDPNKQNRLSQFLGLTPKYQRSSTEDVKSIRNRLVLSCWKNGDSPSNIEGDQFLWKIWYEKGGGEKGDLAASKRFISYLQQTWTAVLCRSSQSSRLFAPEYFFDKETAKAYLNYTRKVRHG